jgi:hypothetical protein
MLTSKRLEMDDLKVKKDIYHLIPAGSGFVTFATQNEADKVISQTDNTEYQGRQLQVYRMLLYYSLCRFTWIDSPKFNKITL